jgi:peptidoglycan/LPS O-acetylase OafA/YrhL
MNETHPPRRTGASIGAVLAGIAAGVVLSLGTDSALRAAGIFSPLGQQPPMSDSLFVLATAYRIVYGVAGGYIIARLAPDRPMQHTLVGGGIGLVVSIVGAVATWNHEPPLGPRWYSLALAVTALPCAWLGGKLRLMQNASQS